MASPLGGGLAAVFGAAFSGLYLPGRLVLPETPEYDDGGSIIPGAGPELIDCRVQVDSVTESMSQAEGYTDRDVRLLILSAGLASAVTTDCEVDVLEGPHAGRWMVASVDRDPAGAYFDCRGRRA